MACILDLNVNIDTTSLNSHGPSTKLFGLVTQVVLVERVYAFFLVGSM